MPRQVKKRLTAPGVNRAGSGIHSDGGGLYLTVSDTGRSWVFRYHRHGRGRWMGLGSASTVSLAEARVAAREQRLLLNQGRDPIAERQEARAAARAADHNRVTFADCASRYIDAHKASWRNEKHTEQWQSTIDTYAEPIFKTTPVAWIDTPLVLKVLEPIWTEKTETATRLRQRIENILDWATARGYRSGDNPARWKGHLDQLLAKPMRLKRVRHHPALPYAEINEFIKALREQDTIAARALEFAILTAARTGEVIGARWEEIDFKKATWTVPGERMKAGRDHRVPLSKRALAILKEMRKHELEWVFPGRRADRPLSNMAMLALLKRMGRTDITTHGFRSSFRDWCAEQTNYPRDVAEMALAHTIKDRAEAAYRRGDLLEKRSRLMADWGRYIDKPATKTATVTEIRSRG